MKWNKVHVLFCCMMLSSKVLTDAYGFSVQGGKKSKEPNKTLRNEPFVKQHNVVDHTNKTITDTRKSEHQKGQMASVSNGMTETIKNDEKLKLEINELNKMHKQLMKERTMEPNNAKKLQLQHEIEKQIRVRKLQLAKRKGNSEHIKPTSSRALKPLYNSSLNFAAISSSTLQNQRVTRPENKKELQSLSGNQNKLYKDSNPNSSTQLQSPVQNNVMTRGFQLRNSISPKPQSGKFQRIKHIVYPHHIMNQNPLTRLDNINAATVQQIPAGHILVPVSALSSAGSLNAQGISDTFMVMNSFQRTNPERKSTKKTAKKLAPPETASAPSSSSTPEKQTPFPTTTKATIHVTTEFSDSELTTHNDPDTIKSSFMKGQIEKQRLEIRKLKLEIRALVREEKQNLPEVEHEDAAMHTQGK
ncbi:uncharacterized protein LOC132747321 [Ruditapes philippinarum]|uniref:uncharacterized protein LOC132747321 n=1 Tax=Ruditapes philippinarum TaxID=129788 RepID=UPI00295B1580|nr:uncharacterized protein LOC132747321 [Ruditapes philippinarum]